MSSVYDRVAAIRNHSGCGYLPKTISRPSLATWQRSMDRGGVMELRAVFDWPLLEEKESAVFRGVASHGCTVMLQ